MRLHLLSVIALCLPAVAQEWAPRHELSFELGGFPAVSRGKDRLDLGPGVAMQVNYGRRFAQWRKAALYGEFHFLASPLREVTASVDSVTRDVATLYVTPGVRLKFLPLSRISPFVAAGAGVAWYEQSRNQLNGQPNTAPWELLRDAFDFGGGADVRVWRFLALRGEVRDFFTGSPAYNLASITGGQHNVVVSAAFVIGWKHQR